MLGDSGSQSQLRLLLQYVTDSASKEQVIQDAQDVNKAFQGSFPGDELGASMQQFMEKSNAAGDAVEKTTPKITANTNELRTMTREGMLAANMFNTLGNASAIAGASIEAGVWGTAAKYIKDATQANEITDAWKNNTNLISTNTDKIGQVMATAVLPQYQQWGQLSGEIASFLQAHPEIATDANMAGELLVGAGAIMKAVGTGIRLVTDIAYISAVNSQTAATIAQTAATEGNTAALSSNGLMGAGGLSGAAATIGTVVLSATSVVLGAEIGTQIANSLNNAIHPGDQAKYGNYGLTDVLTSGTEVSMALGRDAAIILGEHIPALSSLTDKYQKANLGMAEWIASMFGATDTLKRLQALDPSSSTTMASSYQLSGAQQAQFTSGVVKAYESYYKAEQTDAQNNADAIVKIKQDEYNTEQKDAQANADKVASIESNYQNTVAKDTQAFLTQQQNSEQNFQRQRANEIQNENENIIKAEQNLQLRLRELQQTHNDKMYDLVANRDALGIVQENRSYQEQRNSAIAQTNLQIAQEKQALAIRLQQEAQTYADQQQQRADAFAQQLTDAKAQEELQLKQQAEAYATQIEQAKKDEQTKLQQQQDAYNKQEIALRNSLVSQINDLYWSLDSEALMKSQYYQLMLTDATQFMQQYKAALDPSMPAITGSGISAAGTAAVHDYSGYAYTGTYQMAQNGQPEYVLSGAATRAAESMLGGQISEKMMLARLANGAGNGQVTWNDQRRFSGDISAAVKNQNRRDTMNILADAIGSVK
jgi:hypothetical protein